jgi:hypothetical protein
MRQLRNPQLLQHLLPSPQKSLHPQSLPHPQHPLLSLPLLSLQHLLLSLPLLSLPLLSLQHLLPSLPPQNLPHPQPPLPSLQKSLPPQKTSLNPPTKTNSVSMLLLLMAKSTALSRSQTSL